MANGLDILVGAPAVAAHLDECLAALERELSALDDASAPITVTVARGGGRPPDAVTRAPHARWLECETGASLPILFGSALAATNAEWIAFLDADCPVREGWLPAALALCRRSESIIGGAVEPAGLRSKSAWAAYFCDYGAFLPPLPPGPAPVVPGNNFLLRRSALSLAPSLAAPQFWKTLFLQALAVQGIQAIGAPQLVIRYGKNLPARVWLRRRFENGRCFAAKRMAAAPSRPDGVQKAGGLLPAGRLVRVLAAPFVPLILLVRLLGDVWPRGRYRAELALSLPWVLAGLAAWAAGECAGLILGAGSTCERVY